MADGTGTETGTSQHLESTSTTTIINPSSPAAGTFNVLKACSRTLSNREPSLIEHRTLPRSRRRRTSPEDQAVLEAAFLQNPKPDKATKTEIVARVTLGEKEVQIWFQNRRQIARRKASVPAPQDESSILTSSPSVTPTSVESQSNQSTNSDEHRESGSQASSTIHTRRESKIGTNSRIKDTLENNTPNIRVQVGHDLVSKSTNQSRAGDGILSSTLPPPESSRQKSSPRNEESTATQEMSVASGQDTSSAARPQTATGLPPLLVKRQSSSLRLSTSFDGKAHIVVDEGSSPPRPIHKVVPKLARPQQSLQRSQSEFASQRTSALAFGDIMPVPRRLAASRSRDTKSWDLFCDDDARNALTVQAEDEEKGKAETTIGQIRSSKASKQTMSSAHTKRKSSGEKSHSRPKLPRTESSLARMQSTSHNVKPMSAHLDEQSKKGSSMPTIAVELSGDLSDKENWVPGTRRRHVHSPRPKSEMRSRSTLGENSVIPTHSNSLESHLQRDVGREGRLSHTSAGKGNEESPDPEVAAFMGEASLPRVAEDLDCVQQLLSLSQGAWS